MKRVISFVLLLSVYCGLISPMVFQANAQIIKGKTKTKNMNQVLPNGLQFRLSEGAEGAENRQPTQPAKGDALSENETSNLLKRLPRLPITEIASRLAILDSYFLFSFFL